MTSATGYLRRSVLGATLLAGLAGLSGCSTIDDIGGWFGSKKDERLPGARISLMPKGREVIAQDPSFVGKGAVIPGPVRVASWTNPGGTPENIVGNADAPLTLNVAWTADIGVSTSSDSAITASPIVAGGVVYTLDAAANVTATDASTGGTIWQVSLSTQESPSDFYFFSSPGDRPEEGYGGGLAFENGRLFATTGFGQVVGLDARNGSRIWTKQTDTPFHTAPTVRDGRVYAMNRDNRAWALDAKSGAELWVHEVFGETASVLASVSPAASADEVVIPYTNGDLYALKANNGRPIWNDSLTSTGQGDTLSSINDIAGRPVIDGQLIYAISHAGRLVAINNITGERIWTKDVAGVQTPWIAGDYMFVMAMDGNLICLEKRTGKVAWVTYLGRWQNEEDREDPVEWSGPLLSQGHLVLVSTDGRMAIVSPSNGAVEQSLEIGPGSIIAPIAADGAIYVLNNDGVLTAYR